MGRTGVGKSSIINSVVGAAVAETGKYRPTTAKIERYDAEYRESTMVLIDTPGFGDAGWDRSNDERYLALIEQEAGEIDLVLFVTKLDDTRVERSEYDTLGALTKKFGHGVWDRAVVVLTRADKFTRRDYPEELAQRSAALREAMEKVVGDRAHHIPFVPVTNTRERTPDRSRWMAKLWLAMLERVSAPGFDAFVLSTISRVTSEDASEEGDPDPPRQSTPAPPRSRRGKGVAVAPAPTPAPPTTPAPAPRRATTPTPAPRRATTPAPAPRRATTPTPAPRRATTPVVATPAAVVRPAGRRPTSTPTTTTQSYVSDGVPVQHTTINVGAGTANITVNTQQINTTESVIATRASTGLLDKLKAAGSWLVSGIVAAAVKFLGQ
ncbi:GTPase [Micromonospora sp. DT228]|uniref:GTPase n=1 Tax=Micromonospora sp. DT228 TaxID=3393443 RepID=UPI003CEF839D